MKYIYPIIIILAVVMTGCKKNETAKTSGSITIDNLLYGSGPYYAMGLKISTGLKVPTSPAQADVLTILADNDVNNNVRKIYFATNNYTNSFSLYGQYPDVTTANQAYRDLRTFTDPIWAEIGDQVKPNQIWLYKTGDSKYAKIRIISTVGEKRDNKAYAECNLEWVYQPDGTLTFLSK
jgi:hypothetical protein